MPQLWRATRNLLPCGMGLFHLVFVGARLGGGVPVVCCSRLVKRFCTVEASPGAVASGFNASSAAVCCGSKKQTTWSIAWARLEGGASAEAFKVDGERPVLCPRGMVTSLHSEVSAFLTQRVMVDGEPPVLCPRGKVTSLHNVVSAFLTQRVMVELALIITFPSVAAIDIRDA